MKKQTLWLAALAALLMGSVQFAYAQNSMKMAESSYQCNDGSMTRVAYMTVDGRKVARINDMNSTYMLPVVETKSGTRYTDTNVELWLEGKDISFNRNINDINSRATLCKVVK